MNIDRVKELYLEKDYNCAESILIFANEEYGLGLNDDSIKLIGAFGGGMGCGKVCGALAGAVAAIGKMEIAERAHATATLKEHTAEYVARFAEVFGDVDCVKVKEKKFVEGVRCLNTVLESAELFSAFVKEKGLSK